MTTLLRVDGQAAGHVEADAVDRHPALGDVPPGTTWVVVSVRRWSRVHEPGPTDRLLERGAHVGVEPVEGAAQRRARGTRRWVGRTPSKRSPRSRSASAPRCSTSSQIGRTCSRAAVTSNSARGSARRRKRTSSVRPRRSREDIMGHQSRRRCAPARTTVSACGARDGSPATRLATPPATACRILAPRRQR